MGKLRITNPRLTKSKVKAWKRILRSHHLIVFAWAMKNNKPPDDYELMFGSKSVSIIPIGSTDSDDIVAYLSFDEALELAQTGMNIYALTQIAHGEPLRDWEMGYGDAKQ